MESPSASIARALLLEVRRLSKAYRLGASSILVLRDLDLSVGPAEMVAIMGPSGSGKTTLLNCISGIDAPDAGSVVIGGETVDYHSERTRTQLRRDRVGIVFQFFNLIPTLSVSENVALPLAIAKAAPETYADRVAALLGRVGLSARSEHYPYQLSGGEMQLASIARALARSPDVLLADEPTGNVNPAVGRSIMEILRGTAKEQGAAVLMVTHSPEHAAWADRICFLKDGRIAGEHPQAGRADDVRPIHDRLVSLGI